MNAQLRSSYPWAKTPIIAGGPMRAIALAPLAAAISKAGGIGFIGGGFDLTDLDKMLQEAKDLIHEANPPLPQKDGVLPVGVGFLNWGADLDMALRVIEKYLPAAAWFYAPYKPADLGPWAEGVRRVSKGKTQIWVQIGTVAEALDIVQSCKPDVLVVQGVDAGGHGKKQAASVLTLLPEVSDNLAAAGFRDIPLIAAGGIMDGRGLAATLMLGANGVVMGTRFLASNEAKISRGYQQDVLRATDGGTSTARTEIYDFARGTTDWPQAYDGRGIINQTYIDNQKGMSSEENKRLYAESMKMGDQGWGPNGRMTTYAGTGVGLVHEVLPAGEIVRRVAAEARTALEDASTRSRL